MAAPHLAWCCFGVVAGTVVGLLPGIGPLAAMALLLPLVPALDAGSALILLAAVHYGAQAGGTTAASMASRTSGRALAIPALASFLAGCIATLVIAVVLPIVAAVGDAFGPAEEFSFMALALVGSVALASGSLSKAAGMILVGLLLGQWDHDMATGAVRVAPLLASVTPGAMFIGLAIGLFAIGGVLARLPGAGGVMQVQVQVQVEEGAPTIPPAVAPGVDETMPAADPSATPLDRAPTIRAHARALLRALQRDAARAAGPWPRLADLRRAAGPLLLGTLLGTLIGMLPGRSPRLAAIVAETARRRLATRHPTLAADAVLAPESAHHAAAQASLLPLLALGLPVNAVTALMAGALGLKRILPGPPFAPTSPVLPWIVVTSMLIGNGLLLVLNLPLAPLWDRVRRVPWTVLFPFIVVASGLALWALAGNPMDVVVGTFFGLVGALLLRLGCDPAPLLLAFVLGPAMEDRLRRALAQTNGDASLFATRPLAALALFGCIAIASLVWLPSVRERRNALFGERG
ncbi:MAG TPA: tripartite tricarboxylate transporter permease [Burkholderiaceae bacterium]|nr:tripartite tricarboxylate transporter permease [Burkholderiaceae bacterium]